MGGVCVAAFLFMIYGAWCLDNIEDLTFPSEFKFGVATAAYQVEGAWNVSDKSESIWDRLLHTQPSVVMDNSNGDVACDSYHLWRRDIEMLEELGVDMYRFSISWPRLLPSGFPNIISEDGKRYYSNQIDGLLAKGIEPVVTMYHFDLPQSLQDLDRVKTWLTLKEPIVICDGAYSKMWAPYLDDMKIGAYLCNKHVMLAHAKVYRIYDEEYRPLYNGKVSLANIFLWMEPETPDDAETTELMLQMWEGRFGHPIYSKTGGWPPALEKLLNENGKKEGYPYPRLPPFTKEEIEFVKATYDFYGLNHYSTRLVRRVKSELARPWFIYGSSEIGADMVDHPSWTLATPYTEWFAIYPEGFRAQLKWINATYEVNKILITENGLPDTKTDLYDFNRLTYVKRNLEQVLLAINDGVELLGYTAWTLMDNFEWFGGYKLRYGLYSVNFTSPQRAHPARICALLSRVARTRTIDTQQTALNYV